MTKIEKTTHFPTRTIIWELPFEEKAGTGWSLRISRVEPSDGSKDLLVVALHFNGKETPTHAIEGVAEDFQAMFQELFGEDE